MFHEMILGVVGGVAGVGGGTGGPASAPGGPSSQSGMDSTEANTVNIQPIGVNFGSIMQPFTEAPENGGGGFNIPSRLFASGVNFLGKNVPTKSQIPWVTISVAVVAVGVAGYALLR